MKITLAIEWFLNPDHLPFIIADHIGLFRRYGIDFTLIQPDAHYDGLNELKAGNIQFATNEPLHLIEQFDPNILSLGMFFETKGGVLLKTSAYNKLINGETLIVTTPVSNATTDSIGFEIIRRFYANRGVHVTRDQVTFVPNGFEHLKYMREGADAGWLYFYNFEGIQAQHEGMEVLYLDAQNTRFANFSALDLFVHKSFYEANPELCARFVTAIQEAIRFLQADPDQASEIYYAYAKTEKSPLMDDILKATVECFNPDFTSSYAKALPILRFFQSIGITDLDEEQFKTAFLQR